MLMKLFQWSGTVALITGLTALALASVIRERPAMPDYQLVAPFEPWGIK